MPGDLFIEIREPTSGWRASAHLRPDLAPSTVSFVLKWLTQTRQTSSIHAMWTGPEISNAISPEDLDWEGAALPLPVENGTINPSPGDLVLLRIPERLWGGSPDPIFDIGVYYGVGARLLFPVGWLTGSVFAQVASRDLDALATGCQAIRRRGATLLTWRLVRSAEMGVSS